MPNILYRALGDELGASCSLADPLVFFFLLSALWAMQFSFPVITQHPQVPTLDSSALCDFLAICEGLFFLPNLTYSTVAHKPLEHTRVCVYTCAESCQHPPQSHTLLSILIPLHAHTHTHTRAWNPHAPAHIHLALSRCWLTRHRRGLLSSFSVPSEHVALHPLCPAQTARQLWGQPSLACLWAPLFFHREETQVRAGRRTPDPGLSLLQTVTLLDHVMRDDLSCPGDMCQKPETDRHATLL